MRRLILLLSVTLIFISCEKIEEPIVKENRQISKAEEVEGVLAASAGDLSSFFNQHLYIGNLVNQVSANPSLGPALTTLVTAVYSIDMYGKKIVDISKLNGKLTYSESQWNFESTKDFSLCFKGQENEECEINLVLDSVLTSNPLYNNDSLSILIPRTIDASSFVNSQLFCTTTISSIINSSDYQIGFESNYTAGAKLSSLFHKTTGSDDEFLSLGLSFNCQNDNLDSLLNVNLCLDVLENKYELNTTIGNQVTFKADIKNYSYLVLYFPLIEDYISNEVSQEKIEYCNSLLEKVNDKIPIEMYYQGEYIGNCNFQLLEDNYKYHIAFVMTYIDNGTSYALSGFKDVMQAIMGLYYGYENVKEIITGINN